MDLAADLERFANEVEVFAAKDEVRRANGRERSRRYRNRLAARAAMTSQADQYA